MVSNPEYIFINGSSRSNIVSVASTAEMACQKCLEVLNIFFQRFTKKNSKICRKGLSRSKPRKEVSQLSKYLEHILWTWAKDPQSSTLSSLSELTRLLVFKKEMTRLLVSPEYLSVLEKCKFLN